MSSGLSRFLTTTYLTSGIGFTSSLAIAKYVSNNGPISLGTGLAGMGIAIIGVVGLQIFQPEEETKEENGEIIYSTKNPIERLASFGSIVSGVGLIMSPLFLHNIINPNIIDSAITASLFTFSGSALYTLMTENRGRILKMQIPLMGCLSSLIMMQSASILSIIFFGPNEFSNICYKTDIYGGIALFTGIVAYDTSKAIDDYETKKRADHLHHATSLYLDMCNLFVRFVPIMADYYKDKDEKEKKKN